MKLKQVNIAVRLVVDEENEAAVRNFHSRLAAFIDLVKSDFGKVILSSGEINLSDYEGPEPAPPVD